jgi:hypothetical protein
MFRSSIIIASFVVLACSATADPDRSIEASEPSLDPLKDGGSSFWYVPEAGREMRARERLAVAHPAAQLTWSETRGTPASIVGLDLALDGCADPGKDAGKLIAEAFASEPDIFSIDPTEWSFPSATCGALQDGFILNAYRLRLAGLAAKSDGIAFRVTVHKDGSVLVSSIYGSYLPNQISGLEDFVAQLPTLDDSTARDIALRETYDYDRFEYCMYIGSGAYEPGKPDSVFIEKNHLEWTELAQGVRIDGRARGGLTVDPSRHTPELLQSNANCPWGTVSFELAFDPVLRIITRKTPGIDCIVC